MHAYQPRAARLLGPYSRRLQQFHKVTVIDGQSVCWANTGSMTHTVVEDVAGRFGGNLPPGQTLVHTFTGSENYGYHCGIHSTMTGTITGTCKPGVISC